MKEENMSLRTALKWANDEIEALKRNQTNAAEELSEVTEKVIKADREVDQLLRRNIKLEARSRRNNITFFLMSEKMKPKGALATPKRSSENCLLINLKCRKKRRRMWSLKS